MSVTWRCPHCGEEKRGSELTPYTHVHDGQYVRFERERPPAPVPRRGRPPKR